VAVRVPVCGIDANQTDAAKLITPLQVLQWKRDRNPGKYASHFLGWLPSCG